MMCEDSRSSALLEFEVVLMRYHCSEPWGLQLEYQLFKSSSSDGGGVPHWGCFVIADMRPGSPAAREDKLKVNDTIVGVDGRPVAAASREDFAELLSLLHSRGRAVLLTIARAGETEPMRSLRFDGDDEGARVVVAVTDEGRGACKVEFKGPTVAARLDGGAPPSAEHEDGAGTAPLEDEEAPPESEVSPATPETATPAACSPETAGEDGSAFHADFGDDGPTRTALRRILVTYAAFNVSVGYCQSLNFVAAVLLLVAGEEGAFWLLAALCSRVIPDYHTHQMAGLRADTPLLAELVGRTMPQLASHFSDLEVPLEILGSQWFLCMYANVLPTASLLRVWDSALAGGGVESLVSAALATLRRHEARLRQTEDIAGVYAVLAEETPAMWNASALVLEMNERVSELERADRAWEKMRGEREARRREQLAQAAAGSAVAPKGTAFTWGAYITDDTTDVTATGAQHGHRYAVTFIDDVNSGQQHKLQCSYAGAATVSGATQKVLGFANAFVRPVLVVLSLPITILTFGLFLIVVNALVLKLAAALVPGFRIRGFLPAVWGALLLTLLNLLVAHLVGPGWAL